MNMACLRCAHEGAPAKARHSKAWVSWLLFGLFLATVAIQLVDMALVPERMRNTYQTPTAYRAMGVAFFWGWVGHIVFRAASSKQICPACQSRDLVSPKVMQRINRTTR